MARFFFICILILTGMGLAGQSLAQESLRTLSNMDRDQVLDWNNPELGFDLMLPPGANAATLTLYAEPGQTLPASGTILVVSINDEPGVVVAPRPEAFSARIDLPAAHLRAGKNTIRIGFEGNMDSACPINTDGAWQVDLARSRFDLSVSANIASFEALEDWLSAGQWALDRVSISQGDLDETHFAALGALITQGLAVRAGRVPQIVAADRIAGLDFKVRIDPALAGAAMALRPGVRPVVEFQGRNQEDVLAMARLFAGRFIRVKGTRAIPAMLARAAMVEGPQALDDIEQVLAQPAWDTRPYINTVRAPHHGLTRLVVEMERPDWVSPNSEVLISIDGQKAIKKRLKNQINHFTIPMARKSATVVRTFSIEHQGQPLEGKGHCVKAGEAAPARVLSARIETNGYESARGLSRFAIDGAPFAISAGEGAAIVFTTQTDAQLRAAWRAMARVALISGTPLTGAWYGRSPRLAPKGAGLMVFGPRHQLGADMLNGLPQVFATGAAAGPGDYERRKYRPGIARAAFAADADLPAGLGVAGWSEHNGQPVLVMTGDAAGDYIPAMQAFADGPALDFFAGRVVRWRAGLVEINDIGGGGVVVPVKKNRMGLLFLIAGLCLSGLWIRIWQRLYTNWTPA